MSAQDHKAIVADDVSPVEVELLVLSSAAASDAGRRPVTRLLQSALVPSQLLLVPLPKQDGNSPHGATSRLALIHREASVASDDLVAWWQGDSLRFARVEFVTGQAELHDLQHPQQVQVVNSGDLRLLGKVIDFYRDRDDGGLLQKILD